MREYDSPCENARTRDINGIENLIASQINHSKPKTNRHVMPPGEQFPGRYVVHYSEFNKLGLGEGLVLSYVVNWTGRSTECEGGWFRKTLAEGAAETGLTQRVYQRILSRLADLQLIDKQRHGNNGMLHIRANYQKIAENWESTLLEAKAKSLHKSVKPDLQNSVKPHLQNSVSHTIDIDTHSDTNQIQSVEKQTEGELNDAQILLKNNVVEYWSKKTELTQLFERDERTLNTAIKDGYDLDAFVAIINAGVADPWHSNAPGSKNKSNRKFYALGDFLKNEQKIKQLLAGQSKAEQCRQTARDVIEREVAYCIASAVSPDFPSVAKFMSDNLCDVDKLARMMADGHFPKPCPVNQQTLLAKFPNSPIASEIILSKTVSLRKGDEILFKHDPLCVELLDAIVANDSNKIENCAKKMVNRGLSSKLRFEWVMKQYKKNG